MNRKLFNGLLLLTVATGGIGTFTSCKDTEQDFRNEVLVGQQDLSKQIAAIRNFDDEVFKKNLNDYLDAKDYASAADLIEIWEAIHAAQNRLDDLEAAYKKADAEMEARIYSKIETEIANLKSILEGYVDAKFDTVEGQVSELNVKLEALQDTLNEVKANAKDALEKAIANAAAIEGISSRLDEVEGKIGTLTGDLAALDNKVSDLQVKYDTLLAELNALRADFSDLETSISNRLDSLQDQLNNFIEEVGDMYSRIMDKLQKLVTGIEVNQVHNAIFGSFNIPVGINSNVVANYFAMSDHDVIFPMNPDRQHGYVTEYTTHDFMLTLPDELKSIGAPFTKVVEANEPKLEKLADIYMTINPADRDLSGIKLSLVNSQDEPVPALADLTPEKSDKILTMGFSRAADNGFYVAEATPREDCTAADIDGIRYDLEPGLKSAFKDALKNHTKSDLVELSKLLLKQLGKDLPAYAVKCEWDDTELDAEGTEVAVKKSVRSDYELAVATFCPLSYSTGFGFGTDLNLPTPTIGYIRDRINNAFENIKNRLNLGLDKITMKDITIDLSGVKVNIDEMHITVDLEGCPVYEANADGTPNLDKPVGVIGPDGKVVLDYIPGEDGKLGTGDLAPLANAIKEAIEKMLSGEGDDSLTAQIESQLKTQMQSILDDINDQLGGVQAKINNTIDDIRDRINDELNGRFGRLTERLLDLYNALAKKLIDFAANPNAYLQVMMAYMGNDDAIHRLSTTADDATPLAVGNNMELFATSYTAELIVPSFKKYVAVVDAFKTNDPNDHNLTYAKNANETEYLNEIRPGEQQRFCLDGSKLVKGYTYKVVYSSLDYRGFTSTQVYYVKAI